MCFFVCFFVVVVLGFCLVVCFGGPDPPLSVVVVKAYSCLCSQGSGDHTRITGDQTQLATCEADTLPALLPL